MTRGGEALGKWYREERTEGEGGYEMNACITSVPEGGSGWGEEGDIPVLAAIFKWFVSRV